MQVEMSEHCEQPGREGEHKLQDPPFRKYPLEQYWQDEDELQMRQPEREAEVEQSWHWFEPFKK